MPREPSNPTTRPPAPAALTAAIALLLPPLTTSPASPNFEQEILPILQENCLECHSGDTLRSDLSLASPVDALRGGDSGEQTIVPGDALASHLLARLTTDDPDLRMPPKGDGLSEAEIAAIAAWIDDAPSWEPAAAELAKATIDHWSFLPPVRPTPPANGHDHPIDAFLAAQLATKDLDFNPAADPQLIVRRLALTTTGLLPTPAEQEALAGLSPEELADHFLASPHFGERWASHWMDVVRFAHSDGFETNHERPTAFHYRDWLIRAFNEDLPYDEFVQAQIVGDANGHPAATGFLVGGAYDRVKGKDPLLGLMQRQNELSDMVNTTGTAFLGLTFGCAMCHNHKFDPISQTDYFALQAALSGVQHGERPLNQPPSPEREAQELALAAQIADLSARLDHLQPTALLGTTLLIDDTDTARTSTFSQKAGDGSNPPGTGRGHRDDPGGPGHLPNLSGGSYSWWTNAPGRDLFAWHPSAEGSFRIWLSWGSGHLTHSPDATYLLDLDGDPATTADQSPIATVDQRHFAAGSGDVPGKALWSGFFDAGVHHLAPSSSIILRGGASGTAVTADAILLQAASPDRPAPPVQPHLRPPVSPTGNTDRFPPTLAAAVRFTIHATNNGIEPCIDELEIWSAGEGRTNVALSGTASSSGDYGPSDIHKLSHINDGAFGNSRSWISDRRGQGWVVIELATPTLIDSVSWARDREGTFADRLPTSYLIEVAPSPEGPWTPVASSDDRAPTGSPEATPIAYAPPGLDPQQLSEAAQLTAELDDLRAQLATLSTPPTAYAGKFVQPASPTHRLFRGDPLQPREPVAPDGLEILRDRLGSFDLPPDAPEQVRRSALARWLVHPENPLTARVIVNRIWHYHFGQGIVSSPSDFGAMGFPPTHPELLDWLATELVRSGWSLKHIHRLVLTSHAFRQSSAPRAEALAIDSSASLLWRFPPRRLEAEAIRDNVLLLADTLDRTMFGPGFLLFIPNSNYSRNWIPKETFSPEDHRRMVYATKIRMEQDAIFGAFDCPDAGSVTPARSRSTTPIQALNLFNSPFVLAQAEAFAARVAKLAGPSPEAQVEAAFTLSLGRPPSPEEHADALALTTAHGLPQLCRALFNANEFLFIQ